MKKIFAAALFGMAVATTAGAQTYPSKPIRFIVTGTPGSGGDIIARVVAERLAEHIGQAVVVENHPGGGTTIAGRVVARSDPDGHTVLLATSTQAVLPWLYKTDFHPINDFAGVTPLALLPSVLVVPPQRNWKTLQDLIAAARANPGTLNFGSAGSGTTTHLSSEKFKLVTGIQAVHIPFKGTTEGVSETVAGRLDWFFAPAVSVVPLVKAGKLKGLAVNSKDRFPSLPDVPTTAELGMSDVNYDFWVAILAPAKTPKAVVQKLNGETIKVLQRPELRERFRQLGAEVFHMKPDEFDEFLRSDTEAAGKVVKAANIRVQ